MVGDALGAVSALVTEQSLEWRQGFPSRSSSACLALGDYDYERSECGRTVDRQRAIADYDRVIAAGGGRRPASAATGSWRRRGGGAQGSSSTC